MGFPAPEEPQGIGYVHYTDDGRTFQFVYDPKRPERRLPVGLGYSVESSDTLRIQPKGKGEGWTINYRFDGTTLTLVGSVRNFSCRRVIDEEVPGWFREALVERLSLP